MTCESCIDIREHNIVLIQRRAKDAEIIDQLQARIKELEAMISLDE